MRYLSLFSGMEAAHLAWAPLGWECVAVAEIDPAACALLRHRLPGVANLGSVTDITDEQIAALGGIDVVIGGSPCQGLSVAGLRAGLEDARSGLFHEQMRIFNAARHLCGARFLVWENVPGAFSSNKGRDFAVVVGAMAGSVVPVPRDGWGCEGVALGDNGLVEWSVLDAQWFGVAQRRRRVFAVLDTGNWSDRPPVLLEPDRMRGDSAPRRIAGEGVTGTLSARAQGGGGLGTDFECQGGLVAGTLQNSGRAAGSVTQQDVHAGMLVPVAFDTTQVTSKANVSNPKPGDPCHPLCAGAHAPAIAFDCKAGGDTSFSVGDVPGTLRASHGGGHAAVAVPWSIMPMNSGKDFKARQVDIAQPLMAGGPTGGNQGGDYLQQGRAVRRLTPTECERLQGAPDGWTAIPNVIGKPMADGPRYRMLGNSFAVPVIRWIGIRIDAATQAALEKAA